MSKKEDLEKLGAKIVKELIFKNVKSIDKESPLYESIKKYLTKKELAFLDKQIKLQEEEPPAAPPPEDETMPEVAELEAQITELQAALAAKNAEIEELKAKIAELEPKAEETEALTEEVAAFRQEVKDKDWAFMKTTIPKGMLPKDDEEEKTMREAYEKNPNELTHKALTFMRENPGNIDGGEDGSETGGSGGVDTPAGPHSVYDVAEKKWKDAE